MYNPKFTYQSKNDKNGLYSMYNSVKPNLNLISYE